MQFINICTRALEKKACALILKGTFESLLDLDKATGSGTTFGTNLRWSSAFNSQATDRALPFLVRTHYLLLVLVRLMSRFPYIFPARDYISSFNNWEVHRLAFILNQLEATTILPQGACNARKAHQVCLGGCRAYHESTAKSPDRPIFSTIFAK